MHYTIIPLVARSPQKMWFSSRRLEGLAQTDTMIVNTYSTMEPPWRNVRQEIYVPCAHVNDSRDIEHP